MRKHFCEEKVFSTSSVEWLSEPITIPTPTPSCFRPLPQNWSLSPTHLPFLQTVLACHLLSALVAGLIPHYPSKTTVGVFATLLTVDLLGSNLANIFQLTERNIFLGKLVLAEERWPVLSLYCHSYCWPNLCPNFPWPSMSSNPLECLVSIVSKNLSKLPTAIQTKNSQLCRVLLTQLWFYP